MNHFHNFKLWKLIASVERRGSLTQACTEEDIELSTATRKIAALEKELGFPLLDRSKKPAVLSDFSKRHLPLIYRIDNLYRQLAEEIGKEKHAERGKTIRFSSSTSTLVHNFVSLITQYQRLYPEIEIELLSDLKHKDLLSKDIDIALAPYYPSDPELDVFPVGVCANLLVASPEYLKKYGKPESVEDLKHHTLLLKRKDNYPEAESLFYRNQVFDLNSCQLFQKSDADPVSAGRSSRRINDGTSIKRLYFGDQGSYIAALAGKGIAVDLPLSFIDSSLQEGKLVIVLPGWHRMPWKRNLITHKDNRNWSELNHFIHWFREKEHKDSFYRWTTLYAKFGIPVDVVKIPV